MLDISTPVPPPNNHIVGCRITRTARQCSGPENDLLAGLTRHSSPAHGARRRFIEFVVGVRSVMNAMRLPHRTAAFGSRCEWQAGAPHRINITNISRRLPYYSAVTPRQLMQRVAVRRR